MYEKELQGKSFLITGATGLIGSALINALKTIDNVKIIAQVRDLKKAQSKFGNEIEYIVCDIKDLPINNLRVDYIVHAASITQSASFINNPVEVIRTNIEGTSRVLDFAKENKIKGLVYLSTMEVYGNPISSKKIKEDNEAYIDLEKARSSYPESKRLCEALCIAYNKEYGVSTKIARLTQTFGPGVEYNDNRVFAQFARCVIENKDIVLKTKGETCRDYLYIDDAVNAIITLLINGEDGSIYNVANEDTYISIYEMAHMVASKFGEGIKVIVENNEDVEKIGYAPTLNMDLDTSKLKALGWSAQTDLETAFLNTIEFMKQNKN